MGRRVALIAAAAAVIAGCGPALPVAPVAGRVTLDGEPLAGATLTTQPMATDGATPGPGSFGHTNVDGQFELELVKPEMPGAIIGRHRVIITPPDSRDFNTAPPPGDETGDDPRGHLAGVDPRWPNRFSDGSLRLEVPPEGTTTANFELKMSP